MDIIEAGASGYILKECVLEELVQAVKAVTSGQSIQVVSALAPHTQSVYALTK